MISWTPHAAVMLLLPFPLASRTFCACRYVLSAVHGLQQDRHLQQACLQVLPWGRKLCPDVAFLQLS